MSSMVKFAAKLGQTGSLLMKVSLIQALSAVVTFLATVAIARYYNKEILGIYSYVFGLAAYLSTFTEFGTKTSLSKLIILEQSVAKDVMKKALLCTIPLAASIAFITVLITDSMKLNPAIYHYALLFTIYVVLLTVFSLLLSVLRGFDAFMSSVTYTLANRLLFLIMIMAVAFYTKDPFWLIASLSITLLILFPPIIRRIMLFLPKHASIISFTKFLKTSMLFLLITISMFSLYFIDRVIINYFSSFSELGYYTAYYNLANILRIVSGLIPIIIIPLAVKKRYHLLKSLRKLTLFTLPPAVMIGALSPYMVPLLYGAEYALKDALLPWALVCSSFLLLLYSYLNSILVGENPTSKRLFHIVAFDAMLSLILPVICSLLLFKYMGIAAVPSAIALTLVLKLLFNFYSIGKMRMNQNNPGAMLTG